MTSVAKKLLEAEDLLSEVERKLAGAPRVWQREWAASSLRAVRRELGGVEDPRARALTERALALGARLAALDEAEFSAHRSALFGAQPAMAGFQAVLGRVPPYEWDAFTERLLGINEVPHATQSRTTDMIKYQATPLVSILELISSLRSTDVLVDLGAGLGKVPMLVAWLAGVRARGVEFEPAYVAHARARAQALGIEGVSFAAEDAREADYREGTFFYFFYPFDGEVMSEVLARIRTQTEGRAIRLGALHRAVARFDEEAWLEREASLPSGLVIYRTRSA